MQTMAINEDDFAYIQWLISSHTGIRLADTKRDMVNSRLSKRIRVLNLNSVNDYCNYLRRNKDTEILNLVNAITTNQTSFFREAHHFDYINNIIFPELLIRNETERRIKIWSAGCSTGEEAYTLGILANDFQVVNPGWSIQILATDIDTEVLEHAKKGVYYIDSIKNIPKVIVKRYFLRGKNNKKDQIMVKDVLKDVIQFRKLNLIDEWPIRHKFDIIFCRNVLIYLGKEKRNQTLKKFFDLLSNSGHLFLGHSESLHNLTDSFKLVGNSIYKKVVDL